MISFKNEKIAFIEKALNPETEKGYR